MQKEEEDFKLNQILVTEKLYVTPELKRKNMIEIKVKRFHKYY